MARNGLYVALMAVAALSLALGAVATDTPVVNTKYGPVQGTVESGINVFHSIPFASPPLDELRFARPVPPQSWTATKDVSGFPNICPQIHIIGDLFLGNEDCLYLHVYAPATTPNVKLPVMFWIFGGGYMLGDGYEFGFYDGVKLATERNVIIVAPNYRVGALGFLATPELQDADPKHSTGNMALLDQTLALQWVQDNIESFGGDPTKVAIFGESAGGFSICWHLVSPTSRGLFSAAIMESGSCGSHAFFYHTDLAFQYGKNVSNSFGCSGSGAPYLECLRTVSIDQIMNAHLGSEYFAQYRAMHKAMAEVGIPMGVSLPPPSLAPVMPFGPVIDGVSLLDVPLVTLRSGNFNKVPAIFGTNRNEGTIFVPAMPLIVPGTHFPPTPDDLDASMRHFFKYYSSNATAVDWAAKQTLIEYPEADFPNEWRRAAAVLTNFFFTCDTRRAARAVASHDVPIWVYQFTYPGLGFLGNLVYDIVGDYHTSEINFVWGNQWPPILTSWTQKSDFELSSAMGHYWTNMAAVGQPNDQTTEFIWPQFNETLHTINLTWPLNSVENLLGSRCDFWDKVRDVLES